MNRKTDDFPQFHTINPSSECVHVHDEWERPNKRNERTYDKYVVSSALFLFEYFEYRNNERTNNNHNNDDKFTTIKLKIVFELIMQILFSLFWLYVGFFGGYFSYMHGMLSMYIPTDNKVFSSCVSVCICVCVCVAKANEMKIAARFQINDGEMARAFIFPLRIGLTKTMSRAYAKGHACNELF